MNKIKIPPVNSYIYVTFNHPLWEGDVNIYKVIDTNHPNDGYGTIKLQFLFERVPNCPDEIYTDRFSIVEKLWFDEERTGRKVSIITKKEYEKITCSNR